MGDIPFLPRAAEPEKAWLKATTKRWGGISAKNLQPWAANGKIGRGFWTAATRDGIDGIGKHILFTPEKVC